MVQTQATDLEQELRLTAGGLSIQQLESLGVPEGIRTRYTPHVTSLPIFVALGTGYDFSKPHRTIKGIRQNVDIGPFVIRTAHYDISPSPRTLLQSTIYGLLQENPKFIVDDTVFVNGITVQEYFTTLGDIINDELLDPELRQSAANLLSYSRYPLLLEIISHEISFLTKVTKTAFEEKGISCSPYPYDKKTERLLDVLNYFRIKSESETYQNANEKRKIDGYFLMQAASVPFRDMCLSNHMIDFDSLIKDLPSNKITRTRINANFEKDSLKQSLIQLISNSRYEIDKLALYVSENVISLDYASRANQLVLGCEDLILAIDKTPSAGYNDDTLLRLGKSITDEYTKIGLSQEQAGNFWAYFDIVRGYWNISQAWLHIEDMNKGSMKTDLNNLAYELENGNNEQRKAAIIDSFNTHYAFMLHHLGIAKASFGHNYGIQTRAMIIQNEFIDAVDETEPIYRALHQAMSLGFDISSLASAKPSYVELRAIDLIRSNLNPDIYLKKIHGN